ncbi:sensor histidine kinase [Taklimakanibacter lacteus]|uniref:sensor histidine kinase n=1 Tax=Taklimakanibacter lacteus TaxID=2268456 RepID=UPI000E670871
MTGGSFWRMREELSSSALLVGFGLLLLVAALSTYLSWDTSYRSSLARQANEIRIASLELLNAVQSEELAAKDFLVTGDDAALAAHGRAEESLRGKLANLTQLASKVGRHADMMKAIAAQIAVRASRFTEAVEARRVDGLDVVFNQQFRDVSEASLDEVGGLLRQVANIEMASLVESRSDSEIGRRWLAVGSTTSFLLSAFLCVGALLLLRRRVNLLKASERVLSAFNAQLEMSVHQRTAELETAKADIQREKDRAEALLADLNHRVGNSLQIVSSLLGMHGARIQSQEAREVIESVRGSVHAIASAQRRVRLSGSNDLVEVNHFLDNLIHDLRSALGDNDKVTITLKAQEMVAPSHDAVSVGVIITEAINNAVKYAGRGDGPVSIRVTLEADRNKKPLRVIVEDDGAGFDEAGSQAGLGSQITEALSVSLRAKLSRTHVLPDGPRRGTRIELDFSQDAAAA